MENEHDKLRRAIIEAAVLMVDAIKRDDDHVHNTGDISSAVLTEDVMAAVDAARKAGVVLP